MPNQNSIYNQIPNINDLTKITSADFGSGNLYKQIPSSTGNISSNFDYTKLQHYDSSTNNKNNQTTNGANAFGKGGYAIPGLQALGGAVNAYTGLKQYGLAKDTFAFNKNLTRTNLHNQARITNASIADHARASGVSRGLSGDDLTAHVNQRINNRSVRGTL